VLLELYTSAFCDPCHRAREVVAEAERLVPGLVVEERDVAAHAERAEELGIVSTPTTIIRRLDGTEVVRATGVPTLNRLMTALAQALDSGPQ
jgi:thioredoxin 1